LGGSVTAGDEGGGEGSHGRGWMRGSGRAGPSLGLGPVGEASTFFKLAPVEEAMAGVGDGGAVGGREQPHAVGEACRRAREEEAR